MDYPIFESFVWNVDKIVDEGNFCCATRIKNKYTSWRQEEFVQANLIFILYSLLFGEEMCYMICPIVMFWLIKSCLFLFEFIESVEIRVIYFPISFIKWMNVK